MLKSKVLLPAVAAVSLATVWGAGAAQASTVELEQTAANTGSILSVFGASETDRLYDDVRITVQGQNQYVYAGAFQVTEAGTDNDWLAFCVDLFHGYAMPATFEINPNLFSTATLTRLDKLFSNHFADVTTDGAAAGFQVAIWEIVSDSTLNLLSGDFILRDRRLNTTARGYASTFLDGLDDLTGGLYDLTFLENDDVQNLVIANPAAVPLPATGLMLLAGLGAFGIARRKNT